MDRITLYLTVLELNVIQTTQMVMFAVLHQGGVGKLQPIANVADALTLEVSQSINFQK